MIWRKLCTAGAILVLAVILLLHQFGSPLVRYQLEQQVSAYLQEQGYREKEIAQLACLYDSQAQTPYTVKVVFAGTPERVRYYYYDQELHLQESEMPGK